MTESDTAPQSTIIKVELYRRLANNPGNEDDKPFPFLLWGYFDWMNSVEINNLSEFYNASEDKDKGEQNYEIHQLCLYAPLGGKRFEKIEQSIELPPLLVLTEIKINENIIAEDHKTIQEQPDCLPSDSLKRIIADHIDKYIEKNRNRDTHTPPEYQIYSSLGYADFVVVFRTEDYQTVSCIIDDLRTKMDDKKNVKLIRSTYSLTGLDRSNLEQISNNTNYDISLRISLKKPRNLPDVKKEINNRLSSKLKPDIKTVFGKYDLDILFKNFPLNEYAKLFNEPDELFHPMGEFAKSLSEK